MTQHIRFGDLDTNTIIVKSIISLLAIILVPIGLLLISHFVSFAINGKVMESDSLYDLIWYIIIFLWAYFKAIWNMYENKRKLLLATMVGIISSVAYFVSKIVISILITFISSLLDINVFGIGLFMDLIYIGIAITVAKIAIHNIDPFTIESLHLVLEFGV